MASFASKKKSKKKSLALYHKNEVDSAREMDRQGTKKGPVSFGPVAVQVESEPSLATHAFFDRVENLFPRYVSRVRSIVVGAVVFAALFLVLSISARHDMYQTEHEEDPLVRNRWVVRLMLSLAFSGAMGKFVAETHFMLENFKSNTQHYANVYWLSQYANALRA